MQVAGVTLRVYRVLVNGARAGCVVCASPASRRARDALIRCAVGGRGTPSRGTFRGLPDVGSLPRGRRRAGIPDPCGLT